VRRAAFALLASLALRQGGEERPFVETLPLIERAAADEPASSRRA
jgi:hypothetical protein